MCNTIDSIPFEGCTIYAIHYTNYLLIVRTSPFCLVLSLVIMRGGTDPAKDPFGSGKQSLTGFKYFNNAIENRG